jgi:hypothetical protein
MKEKNSTNTNSSSDPIVYILSHVIKMKLFLSQLWANIVLPCVPIFDFLKYNNNNYFEII